MPKRIVRLYDTVSIPALDKSPEKVKFLNDNFFGPQRDSSLIVRVAATHAGLITRNNGFYLPDKMADGAITMLTPFPKPILLHHDSHKDAVGRIIGADYINTSNALIARDNKFKDFIDPKTSFFDKINLIDALLKDGHLQDTSFQGLGYLSVVAKITDPEAIQKITDDRYMTVSIGASTNKAICSICKVDWVDEGPCEHRPGETYDEKPAFIIAGNLMYEELSFVNTPADPFAKVIEIQNGVDDIQRIEFKQSEESEVVDEKAQLFLITDDQHFAANLLQNKEGESTSEAIKDLLQEVEKANEAESDTKEESKINDDDGAINVGGRHEHMKDARTGGHIHHVDDDLPGDHMHTEDNNNGLHFHFVSEKSTGSHKHDGKNPMGVHEHPEREEDDNIDKEASGTDNVDDDSDEQEDTAHRSPASAPSASSSKKKKKKKMKNSMEEDTVEKPTKQVKTDADDKELTEDELKAKEEKEKKDSVENKASDTKVEEGNAEVTDDTTSEETEEGSEEVTDETDSEDQIEDTKEEEESDVKDASEILGALALTDIVDAEKLTAKIKEAYNFFTDEQIQEAVEGIQNKASKKGFEDNAENIFTLIHKMLGIIEDRDFNADEMYAEFEKMLDEAEASDAKLSTGARKKLPNSAFCGPNRSFPVPDCAHVTAARRLSGKAKVTAATKTRILACVSRKAKALGCSGKDESEVKPKTDETQEVQTEKKELTCDSFKELSNEQIETVAKWVQAEMEDRELVSEEEINTKELETLKEREESLVAESKKLQAQLSALRSELKDVYGDCADLEDAKAELLEKLHTERAQKLCDLRVLIGEIKDQGELEKSLEEEVEKASEVVKQSLKDISDKINLYEIADKVNDGMGNKPEGTVEDPTLSNNEETQEPDSRIKIREHYRKLLASKGQRDADSYRILVLRSGLVPANFKF